MRIFQLTLLALLLSNCRTGTDELIGHWHSVPANDSSYWTLDVTDSSTLVNKYNVLSRELEFPRFDSTGKEFIILNGFEEYTDYQVRNDTLILDQYNKFVKVEEDNFLKDYFLGSLVRVNLPKSNGNSKPDLLKDKQWTAILVGSPKRLPTTDSVSFQTNDVIIGYEHLTKFAQIESDKWWNSTYNLIIHADSSTSESTLDSMRTLLEPFDFIEGFYISRFNHELDRLEYEELNSR